MGIFSESWQTIDKTTCNPRATETTENSPGPATTRDGGVNSRRNLLNELNDILLYKVTCVSVCVIVSPFVPILRPLHVTDGKPGLTLYTM